MNQVTIYATITDHTPHATTALINDSEPPTPTTLSSDSLHAPIGAKNFTDDGYPQGGRPRGGQVGSGSRADAHRHEARRRCLTSPPLYRFTMMIVKRQKRVRVPTPPGCRGGRVFQFRLDGASGVPPYLQLVHQVRQSLLLGYLREGDRLPTVKDVSSDMVINPNTVVKAYRQLEHEGLAGGRPGQGTFITGTLSPAPPDTHNTLRASLEKWLRDGAAAGRGEGAGRALIAGAPNDMRRESV